MGSTQAVAETAVAVERPDLADFVAEFDDTLRACLMRDTRLDRAAAEDALQTAYERALRHQDRPCTVRELVSWVLTVARNAAVDEQRSQLRRVRLTTDLARHARLRVRDIAEDVASRDHCRAVVADVTSLPSPERDVFVLKVRDGLTVGQIAALLDLPERRVRYLLAQARRSVDDAEEARNRLARRSASLTALCALRRLRAIAAPAALSMSMILLVNPPTVVLPAAAQTQPLVSRPTVSPPHRGGGVAMTGNTAAIAGPRAPVPPSAQPTSGGQPHPRLRVEASACAPTVGCVGTTDHKPPATGRGRAYVYVPGIAGQPGRYVYADPPGPDACSYMPSTDYTGCVPASSDPSPTPTPTPESR